MNEMLIAADAGAIAALDEVIGTRATKAIRENLSTLQGIHAWGVQRRLPPPLRAMSAQALHAAMKRAAGRVLVRLFSYASEETSKRVLQRFFEFLDKSGLIAEQIPQPSGPPLFVVPINAQLTESKLLELLRFPAVRRLRPEPSVQSSATNAIMPADAHVLPLPNADLPLVGVFEGASHPTSTAWRRGSRAAISTSCRQKRTMSTARSSPPLWLVPPI